MQSSLRDKIVLITGGSSGIGRETALQLATLGAKVSLAARNRATLDEVCQAVKDRGAEALAVPTDVTDADQCRHAVATTVERFGGLDVLVNSAGLSMRAYFEHCQLDAMDTVMRVNFFGTLAMTHFALPHVRERQGSLVAISSLTGVRGIPSYSLYGASKFAVRGLYEALRLELRRHRVHVGVVSPGFVATPLRENVVGPDGKPWPTPPTPPLKVWPVEKVAAKVVKLIARRQREVLIPWYVGPLLALDELIVASWIGDAVLRSKFPPENWLGG